MPVDNLVAPLVLPQMVAREVFRLVKRDHPLNCGDP